MWQVTSRTLFKNVSRSSTTTAAATTVATASSSSSSVATNSTTIWNRSRGSRVLTSLVASTAMTTATTIVLCESNNNNNNGPSFLDRWMKSSKDGTSFDFNASLDLLAKEVGGQVQTAVDSGIPTQLSYGFISGYCSGLALKKVGRMAATVFGLGFVVMQTLSYSGYIEVDHVKIRKDVEQYFDLDHDGDFDQDDAKLAYAKALSVLQYNMPAGSGFGLGFLGGLRSG